MGLFDKKETKGIRSKTQPRFKVIGVDTLRLAPYQRALSKKRIEQYAKEYDPDIFGIILVSYRDGHYWIVDGQHRVEVAKLIGEYEVLCQVITGLTYEQEAEKFHKINDRKVRLNANHKFHAKIEAKDKTALEILSILKKYGLDYSKEGGNAKENTIISVGAVQNIYRMRYYQGLSDVIEIIKRAWCGDKESLRSYILKGVNTFIVNYTYDKEFLIKVLEGITPEALVNKSLAFTEGSKRIDNGNCFVIAKTIRDLYDEAVLKSKSSQKPCGLKEAA